jgi:quinol monooxygenase YgiN
MLKRNEFGRREFLMSSAAVFAARNAAAGEEMRSMYGSIGNLTAAAGKRDELIAILISAVAAMPGCISYIVARDAKDENPIWVTEIWDDKQSHDDSLKLPVVMQAIAAGRPLIAAFGTPAVTEPVGGFGLPATKKPG